MAQKVKADAADEGLEIEAEVQKMELRPGDVIVVRCKERIRHEFAIYLQKRIRRLFPDHEVIVIDGGIELQILRDEEE